MPALQGSGSSRGATLRRSPSWERLGRDLWPPRHEEEGTKSGWGVHPSFILRTRPECAWQGGGPSQLSGVLLSAPRAAAGANNRMCRSSPPSPAAPPQDAAVASPLPGGEQWEETGRGLGVGISRSPGPWGHARAGEIPSAWAEGACGGRALRPQSYFCASWLGLSPSRLPLCLVRLRGHPQGRAVKEGGPAWAGAGNRPLARWRAA